MVWPPGMRARSSSVDVRYARLDTSADSTAAQSSSTSRKIGVQKFTGSQKSSGMNIRLKRNPLGSRQNLVVFLVIFAILGLGISFNSKKASSFTPTSYVPSSLRLSSNHERVRPQYFRTILPVSLASSDLCKLLYSTMSLMYPIPILLHYGDKYKSNKVPTSGWTTSKIDRTLHYLNTIETPRYDDDLAVILDGPDVLFQLRPEILIQRWWRMIQDADARLDKSLGTDLTRTLSLKHRVIFSAQKSCYPLSTSLPACFAVPESPLPKDIYGPNTDKDTTQIPTDNIYQNYRPRYLNPGSIIGTVAGLRAIFNRAAERVNRNEVSLGSDEGPSFAEIFGEQEFAREVLRRRVSPKNSKLPQWRAQHVDHTDSHDHMPPLYFNDLSTGGKAYEFGITLDYWGELIQPSIFAESDTAFPTFSNESSLADAATSIGNTRHRSLQLPPDLTTSTPPFWSYSGGHIWPIPNFEHTHAATNGWDITAQRRRGMPWLYAGWHTIPLLTNMWTGTVPVALHFHPDSSSPDSPRRAARDNLWSSTWYAPWLRRLSEAASLEPVLPLAEISLSADEYALRFRGSASNLPSPPPAESLPSLQEHRHKHQHQLQNLLSSPFSPNAPPSSNAAGAAKMVQLKYFPDHFERFGPRVPMDDANHPSQQTNRFEDICGGAKMGNKVFGDERGKWRGPMRWPYTDVEEVKA